MLSQVQPSSGLQAIILHDSYYRGLRTRIDCDGHTNNLGTNGAGKTSALILIPVFYGQEPRLLMERAANKDNFVDRYLPSDQSLVVFEYLRDSGPCCAVLYRKNDNSYAYRFVTGRAEGTLFHPALEAEFQKGTPARTLLKSHLQELGIKVSNQIELVTDYRAILANDLKEMNRNGKAGRIWMPVARDYCLGSSATHMQHIESLTSVLLTHNHLLEQFKRMLIASFLENEISIATLPYNNKDQHLIRDLESLQQFQRDETSLRHILSDRDQLRQLWREILACRARIDELLADWQQRNDQLKSDIIEVTSRRQQAQAEYQRQRQTLTDDNIDCNDDLARIKRRLDKLYEDKSLWDDQNMGAKQEDLRQLGHYREQLQQARDYHQQITEGMAAEEQALRLAQADLRAQALSSKETINLESGRVKEEFHRLERKYWEHLGGLLAAKGEALNALRQAHETQAAVLLDRWHQAKLEDQTAEMPTQAEQSDMTELQADLDAAYQEQVQAHERSTAADKAVADLQRQQRELTGHHDTKRRRMMELTETDAQLRQVRYPRDNTLLAYLKGSVPDWATSIGKVIQPALLNRTDLEPVYLTDKMQRGSCYGLELNLSRLEPAAQACSEAELDEQLEQLRLEMGNLQEDMAQLELQSHRLGADLKAAQQQQTLCQSNETKAKNKVEQTRLLLDSLKNTHREAMRKRRISTKQQVEATDRARKQFEQERKQQEMVLAEQHEAIRVQAEADWQVEVGEHEEKLAQFERRRQRMDRDLQSQLQELQTNFARQCQAKGIDPETVRAAGQRLEQAAQWVKTVEGYQSMVDKYQDWLRVEWARKPEWETREGQLSKQLETLRQQLTTLQQEYATQDEKRTAQLNEYTCQQLQLDKQISQAEGLQCNMAALSEEGLLAELEPDPQRLPGNADAVLVFAQQAIKDENGLRFKLVRNVRDVVSGLERQQSKSRIYEYWQGLYQARRQTSQHNNISSGFALESVEDIATLLDVGLPQIQHSVLVTIRAIGSRIAEYYDSLEVLNRKVNGISHTLKSHFNTAHAFTFLSDINVSLASKVREFGLWGPLQTFRREWEQWYADAADQLPSTAFVQSLALVFDEMQRSRIDNDLFSLVELTISLSEYGIPKRIHTDNDLKQLGSTGTSELAIIVVFCAMTRYLCPDRRVRIHWPLDELGRLAAGNVALLFELMDKDNIVLFCAQPDPSPALSRLFAVKNQMDRTQGVRRYLAVHPSSEPNPLLAAGAPGAVTEPAASHEVTDDLEAHS